MRAGIAETDAPGVSRTKLAASVAEQVPDEEERRWLEPRLAFLLGLEERPAGGGEELFAAWRTFFERISDRGHGRDGLRGPAVGRRGTPRLHRVDARVVAHQAHLHRDAVAARAGRPSPELGRRRSGTSWRSTWSRSRTRRWPSWSARCIPGAADGAVATDRRACRGRAAVRRRDDPDARRPRDAPRGGGARTRSSATSTWASLNVPETLHALIASRLDALGPEDRALLQDAAVVGKSFTLETLAVVTGAEAAALEPRLADLCPQGVPGTPGRSPLARARPIRVRAEHHPRGRVRDALEGRPTRPPPRRRAPLRGRRRRRARRRGRRPLRRGARRDPRGSGCRCARRPRAGRAGAGRRAGHVARLARPGPRVRGAGPRDHAGRSGARRAPPAGLDGGVERPPARGTGDLPAGGGRRPPRSGGRERRGGDHGAARERLRRSTRRPSRSGRSST